MFVEEIGGATDRQVVAKHITRARCIGELKNELNFSFHPTYGFLDVGYCSLERHLDGDQLHSDQLGR